MLRSFMALPPSGHSMANGTPNNVSEIFGMCWPTNLTVCNMKMTPVLCCIVFLFVSMLSAVARQQEKPRVIVTTDGEIDIAKINGSNHKLPNMRNVCLI